MIWMARSAKQVAAQRKASAVSARLRKLNAQVTKINQDGPPKLKSGKRIGEGLVDSVSIPKSSAKRPAKPKGRWADGSKMTDWQEWKYQGWGMGSG